MNIRITVKDLKLYSWLDSTLEIWFNFFGARHWFFFFGSLLKILFEIFIDSYVVTKKCEMYGEFPFTPFPHLSLEKGMATHSSILAWKIPWTEESGGLQSMGSQRVGHDWSNLACMHVHLSHQMPTSHRTAIWKPGSGHWHNSCSMFNSYTDTCVCVEGVEFSVIFSHL